ncbi:MAG: VOC family protein [Xanthobacteraceae bacterium]|jgi:PhnB protein
MQMNPYLGFDGKCEAAFKFYEKVFGGKIVMMMKYGDSPMAGKTPPELKDNVMHARITVADDVVLMGSDAPPQMYEPMKGMSVSVSIDKPDDADRIFAALAENGTVRMPIQETFWAQRFGMLTDQFGTPWMINCERPNQ